MSAKSRPADILETNENGHTDQASASRVNFIEAWTVTKFGASESTRQIKPANRSISAEGQGVNRDLRPELYLGNTFGK